MILAGILGIIIIIFILWDGFETIILPRRVTRDFRLTRLFYRSTWKPYSAIARRISPLNRRESFISYFGPLSLLLLIIFWGISLMIGFTLVQWSLGSQINIPTQEGALKADLFLSIASFFTFGLNDIYARSDLSRLVALVEGGVGYGFLALVISYLPALNSAFSRREVNVTMLDERAGSPPTAYRLLIHCKSGAGLVEIKQFLLDWERWTADLMESHLSYPVLAYFRSQHENQSWITALAMILDLCSLIITGIDDLPIVPANLAFAIARHAVVDLTQVFNTPPCPPETDRLPAETLANLREHLSAAGVELKRGPQADRKLCELRELYEPYLNALANLLIVNLPPWLPEDGQRENWKTSAWE